MRAVIYAHYSSDNQREASIEDQIEVCRRLIDRQGWHLIDTYEDRALSGANSFRPAYQQLLKDAKAGKFDVVVCEALDRLSRKLADVASLHDQLSYLGVGLHTVSTGDVTPMHIGMLGTMAQMYLSDLREKTRQGQLGRLRDQKVPGGHAYGYDIVETDDPDTGGVRQVNPDQAAVVRRIFQVYADGESPRSIARRLNAEGIPGPGGRPWRDTAIRGQADRGTGILNNEVYVGRLVWNRCSYVKNPKTGRRVARPNPPEQWEIVEAQELRIIDDALWGRVKKRQARVRTEVARDEQGNALNRAHRREYLLSGILKCGVCGGGYTIGSTNRYVYATRRTKGTCSNSRTITRQEIETRVLAGLKDRLLAPELVEEFVRAYQEEINRAQREAAREQESDRKELEAIQRRIDGIVQPIEDGAHNQSLKSRLDELEARKFKLQAKLAEADSAPVIRMHPRLAEVYRDKVARLEHAPYGEETRPEAMEIIRSLIDRIVLTPTDDGLEAGLHGDLAKILGASTHQVDSVMSPMGAASR